jgi:hypothetical protein
MAAVLKKCSRCDCQHKGTPQPIEKFLKKGLELKGCLDCRTKSAERKGKTRRDKYSESLCEEEKILFDESRQDAEELELHFGQESEDVLHDPQEGQVDEIAEEVDEIAEEVDEIAEEVDEIAEEVDEIVSEVDEIVGEKKSTKSKRIEPKTYSLAMERMLQYRQNGKCRGGSRCDLNIQGKKIYHNGPCYENDHRIALHRWDEVYPNDKTGYNDINNRQLLCGNCHLNKSIFEKKMMRDTLNASEKTFLSRLEKAYSENEMDEDVSEVQWT